MTTKQQSSQRRVHCASTLITLAVVVLFGCSQKALAQQHNLTRTLPTTVNSEVDIGDFAFTNGAGSLWISVTVPSSGYSVAKEYLLPIQHDQNANVWQTALPAASTGSYNGNDFALDIKVNQGTASLRLRTTASSGGSVGTAYIVIKQEGASDTFTGSTTTSAVSAPTTLFGSTALTQVGGNVGVGTTNPSSPLEISRDQNAVVRLLNLNNLSGGSSAQATLSFFEGGTEKAKIATNSSGASGYIGGGNALQIWNFSNSPTVFATNSTERMRITPDGNVGMGTTSPGGLFHGKRDQNTNTTIVVENADTGAATYASLEVRNGPTVSDSMRVLAMGSSWPNQGGFAQDSGVVSAGTNLSNGLSIMTQANAPIRFYTNSHTNERMRIDPSGNVGIGTTGPAYKLDVAGNVNGSALCIAGNCKTAWSDGPVSSVFGRTGAVVAAANDYTWAQINKSTSSLADITTRSASDLSSGTLPDARFPSTLPAASGVNLTGLNASNLANGTVATARLGSGTANSTTFLRGDNTWAMPTDAVTSVFGRTGVVVAATNDYTWAQINKTTSSLADLTTRSAGDLLTGTVAPARLGSGTANTTTFLRGDNTWAVPTGAVTSVFGRTGVVVAATSDYTWAQINKTTSSLADLTTRSAGDLLTGTVAPARLGSGTANTTTFLRGDNTWAVPSGDSQWSNGGSNSISYSAGNVGIGTTTPSEKLHVVGNGKFTGNLTVDGNIAAKYQDLAEWVESSQELSAGTVVVVDHTKSNQVIASTEAYDTRVAGVISSQPGIALGEAAENKVLVATTGRVRIRVDASYGPIQVGDLLVTSDIPGVAMKSQPVILGGIQLHRPGTLVGKALEPLAKGRGEILVLLSLQ